MLEWSYIGDGVFWCFLNLSPNVLEDSPIYSSSHSTLSYLYLYDSTFPEDGIFILGSHKKASDGLASKVHLYPKFAAYFLQTLTQPFWIKNNHIRSLVVSSITSQLLVLLLFLFWSGALILSFILLIAHAGYLRLTRTLCRCSSSFCKS